METIAEIPQTPIVAATTNDGGYSYALSENEQSRQAEDNSTQTIEEEISAPVATRVKRGRPRKNEILTARGEGWRGNPFMRDPAHPVVPALRAKLERTTLIIRVVTDEILEKESYIEQGGLLEEYIPRQVAVEAEISEEIQDNTTVAAVVSEASIAAEGENTAVAAVAPTKPKRKRGRPRKPDTRLAVIGVLLPKGAKFIEIQEYLTPPGARQRTPAIVDRKHADDMLYAKQLANGTDCHYYRIPDDPWRTLGYFSSPKTLFREGIRLTFPAYEWGTRRFFRLRWGGGSHYSPWSPVFAVTLPLNPHRMSVKHPKELTINK